MLVLVAALGDAEEVDGVPYDGVLEGGGVGGEGGVGGGEAGRVYGGGGVVGREESAEEGG